MENPLQVESQGWKLRQFSTFNVAPLYERRSHIQSTAAVIPAL
jgi:hypothetical protein